MSRGKWRFLPILCLFAVIQLTTADAATLYVSQAGDNSDGATWRTAYTTISSAIASSKAMDHILVMEGTYYESILIEKPVFITGGYSDSHLESGGLAQDRNDVSLVDGSNTGNVAILCTTSCALSTISIRNETKAVLSIYQAAEVRLSQLHVYDGEADFIGGGITIWSSHTIITDSTIDNNRTYGPGGGIYILEESNVIIENCTIANNAALSGGGISINRSTLSVNHCNFKNNISTSGFSDPAGPGGAMQISHAHVAIENCLFQNNHGTFGNQLWISGNEGPVLINNSTFYTSQFSFPDDFQIALRLEARPIFTSCIFWGMGPIFALFDGSRVTVDHSCVLGGYPGEGNISDDPLFLDPASEDFRLQHNSPCIDTGAMSGALRDLDGNVRPVDVPGVGRDGANAFDMGAFEFQLDIPPVDPRTDINLDGFRDLDDLLLLMLDWGRVSGASGN